jgi:tartrate dehydrogenase/decarboxylase/D-malate dehydrogenase
LAQHKIAVIPGDGIGKEVVPEGLRVLDAAARKFKIELKLDHFDWSCDYYLKHGTMMPDDWKEQIGRHDAIFFGAVGWPAKVPDHVSLWGSLIKFRRDFDQYVNLRPCRLMPGMRTPLADRKPGDIDFYVVRENTEGEYSSVGGRMYEGTEREIVFQQSVFSRKGVDRILKFAFELAKKRPKNHLTSATKSNGISITMPYWDERVETMAKAYPDVKWDKFHIDILSAHFVQHPDWSATSCRTSVRRARGRSRSRRRAISIPSAYFRRYSSRCTARRRTSTARALRIRSVRFGRGR